MLTSKLDCINFIYCDHDDDDDGCWCWPTNHSQPSLLSCNLLQPEDLRWGQETMMNECEWLDLKNHIIVLTPPQRGGRNFLCCKLKRTPGLIGRFSSNVIGPLLLNHHPHGKRVHDFFVVAPYIFWYSHCHKKGLDGCHDLILCTLVSYNYVHMEIICMSRLHHGMAHTVRGVGWSGHY